MEVSDLENGKPTAISNAKIGALFTRLNLPANGLDANYLKWWRDNGK